MKIEISLGYLFDQDFKSLNPNLTALLTMKPKHAGLKYDVEIRLAKALDQEMKNYDELRTKLCEEYSSNTIYIDREGKEQRTKFTVSTDTNGISKATDYYNIPEEKKAEFNEKFIQLLENKIELNCNKISLSKLELESDVSTLNFRYLEPFISE